MLKHLLLLASILALTHAQVFSFGPCPNITPKQNFIFASFAGKWYQQYRYPNALEGTGKCATAQFAFDNVTGSMSMTNNVYGFTDLKEIKTNANLSVSITGSAQFKAMKITPTSLFPDNPMVIDTDYTGYAVLYSCQNFFLFHFKTVWIYTREKYMNPFNAQLIVNANAVLDANKLSRTNTTLLVTDQFVCPLLS